MIIPYYAETNPEFVALAKRTVEEMLADANEYYRLEWLATAGMPTLEPTKQVC
jgi:hypothetical protein